MTTSSYPTAKDNFSTKRFKQDVVGSDHMNFAQSAIRAIQDALGTDPQGTQADVKTLLQRCLATNGAMRQGTSFPASPNEGDFFYRTDQDIVYVYDGSGWDPQSGVSNYAAGAYLIAGPGYFQDSYSPGASYVKFDEFYVPRAGALRIKFWMEFNSGSGNVFARIYRNGSAVGTERSDAGGGSLTEYSEDISGWSAGDLVQLYAKADTGGSMRIGGMRLFENLPEREMISTNHHQIWFGSGVPNSNFGSQGDLYLRNDGGASTTVYAKTGASTWTALT